MPRKKKEQMEVENALEEIKDNTFRQALQHFSNQNCSKFISKHYKEYLEKECPELLECSNKYFQAHALIKTANEVLMRAASGEPEALKSVNQIMPVLTFMRDTMGEKPSDKQEIDMNVVAMEAPKIIIMEYEEETADAIDIDQSEEE